MRGPGISLRGYERLPRHRLGGAAHRRCLTELRLAELRRIRRLTVLRPTTRLPIGLRRIRSRRHTVAALITGRRRKLVAVGITGSRVLAARALLRHSVGLLRISPLRRISRLLRVTRLLRIARLRLSVAARVLSVGILPIRIRSAGIRLSGLLRIGAGRGRTGHSLRSRLLRRLAERWLARHA